MRKFKVNGTWEASISDICLHPTTKFRGSRRVYRLGSRFRYLLKYKGGADSVIIPEGYETDFASIPHPLQLVLGNRDNYLEESLIHDWLCDHGQPRFYTNAKMRSVMFILGRPRWRRIVIFYGLMFFGYKSAIMDLSWWLIRKVRGKKWKSA